jgi:hypothetical protein
MEIQQNYLDVLADEIKLCRSKMNEESDFRKKVYYYSGIYGMTRRIINFEYDSQLQFIDFVLTTTYNIIQNRIKLNLSGDNVIPISNDFFDELSINLEILEDRIRNNDDTYDVLEKIVNLSYLLEGNGYYLTQKGVPVYIKN